MFLIVDNTHRKVRDEIKRKMSGVGLPCVISDMDHADLYMPCALVIVTEKYLLEDVKFISRLNGRTPVVLWDETDIVAFTTAWYKELYNIDLFNYGKNCLLRQGNDIIFHGRRMFLTKTERKIVISLIFSMGWHDKEKLAAYCLKNGKKDCAAIPVHICNINSKARNATFYNLIKYKRYVGYSI